MLSWVMVRGSVHGWFQTVVQVFPETNSSTPFILILNPLFRGDRKGVHRQGVRVIKCHRLFLVYLWSNATQKIWLFLEMA